MLVCILLLMVALWHRGVPGMQGHLYYEYPGQTPIVREKRGGYSVNKSLRAVSKILAESRFVFSNGFDRVYVKQGDYGKAVQDFFSAQPTAVRDVKGNGGQVKQGRVGRIKMRLEHGDDKTVLILFKPPVEMIHFKTMPHIREFIVYEHK